jgi:hypothetical protein
VEIDDLQQWFILAHDRLSSQEFLMSAVAVASGIPDVLHYEETIELEKERSKKSAARRQPGGWSSRVRRVRRGIGRVAIKDIPDSFFGLASCLSADREMPMCSLLIDKVTARMTWTPELVGPKAEALFPLNDSEDFADLVFSSRQTS